MLKSAVFGAMNGVLSCLYALAVGIDPVKAIPIGLIGMIFGALIVLV